ncbi:MAG: ABC transporter ATP-binding protein [Deltaproteobacteria bacterium]|nr:ABC transporter ATP-binding protein [Deltaproteobacteria bacterium]
MAQTQQEFAIEIRDLHKSFGEGRYHVYSGLDVKIPKGLITFILGPSGVGKSVLLKHTLGLLKPDRGDILIFGRAIPYDKPRELNEMRKHFGMLFQYAALFDDFTVFQNVAFPLVEHRKDITLDEIKKKVVDKLRAVGLDPENTLDKYPSELSGGMKKRVGLARAIVLEPQILLYDEPTTGLDPVTRAMVDDLILETNAKFGLTSVVISHDILSALYSADQIGFLHGGKIVFWGTPKEFTQCNHEVVRNFLDAEMKHRKELEQ